MTKAHHRSAPLPVRRTMNLSVAPFEGFDRSASLAVLQEVIDDQLAGFTEGELKVLLTVLRATNGGQREAVALSVRVLCNGSQPDSVPGKGTGLSPRTVQAACASLEAAGYLRVARRIAPDGSGMPSLFTVPLQVPGVTGESASPKFPGYASGRRVRLPLLIIDRLLAELSGAELKVLLYVLRHTFCVGKPDEVMPMARLVENTGLSLRHTRLAASGLSTRGMVLVQHRQDAERGKLPSRFGVRVIGEAPPFAALTASPGTNGRSNRVEEAPAEAPRPVWLVQDTSGDMLEAKGQAPMSNEQPSVNPILQVFSQNTVAAPQPGTSQSIQPPQSGPATGRSVQSGTPYAPRSIPIAMLRDPHPAWAAVKQILSQKLSYRDFSERVATTSSIGTGGEELLIAVQDENHRWWMESKLSGRVRAALTEAGYPDLRIRYLNYTGAIPIRGETR